MTLACHVQQSSLLYRQTNNVVPFRKVLLARPAQKAGVYGVGDILHCRPSLKGLVSPLGREGAVLCPVPDGAGEEAAGTTCADLVAHDCLMVIFHQNITSGFSIMAGSAFLFISRCPSTTSFPKMRPIYPFIIPP